MLVLKSKRLGCEVSTRFAFAATVDHPIGSLSHLPHQVILLREELGVVAVGLTGVVLYFKTKGVLRIGLCEAVHA